MTLQIICAWCGKDMGSKPDQGVTWVTHGICDACLERETRMALEAVQVLREIKARMEEM